jgi:hypothetical protein
MVDESSLMNLPIRVREAPHWRVEIKPQVSGSKGIVSLTDCWDTLEACRVPWSGWDYPYVHKTNRDEGPDWIASWCESSWRNEYWKFFQSGQFLHLFSFREDKETECEALANSQIRFPSRFRPTGFTDVGTTVELLTEIIEFAARLSKKGLFAEASSIGIHMNGVKDRVLFKWNRRTVHFDFCAAKTDVLRWERTVPIMDLVAHTRDLAIDAAIWFFQQFDYSNPPRRAFEEEQRQFVKGGF